MISHYVTEKYASFRSIIRRALGEVQPGCRRAVVASLETAGLSLPPLLMALRMQVLLPDGASEHDYSLRPSGVNA